jgi:hypothetical protein
VTDGREMASARPIVAVLSELALSAIVIRKLKGTSALR